ncbi:MAG TPA: mechanosensitive ion channel family protein [Verrucomicrobiae bacterium]|nr:mechanosensitive ion channel family protein [Verrucomicrobiae bacterium]
MAPTILPANLQTLIVSEGINLIAAILILVLGWMLSGAVARWTRAGLDRVPYLDPTLKPMLSSFVRYAILLATLGAVLQRFGVATTSLLAVFGAAGLAIGLALQGTLSNVASGVMLLILRPFHVGEVIGLGDSTTKSTVREIGLFRTRVLTRDNIHLSIPNSTIFSATIVNYTREPIRRIDFDVPIDRQNDVAKAEAAIVEALKADPRVLKTPEPVSGVHKIDEYALVLLARCWVNSADQFRIPYDLKRIVTEKLDAAGILIPVTRQAVAKRDEIAAKKTQASQDSQ